MVTDAGEKRGRDVALRFEQMRAAFGVLFQKINVSIPVPLQIVAFRDTRELRAVSPLWQGKPTQVAGFFQNGEDRNFIAIDLSSEAGWEVVFHEYAHILLNGNLPPMPAWFDEGFAEYCSSLKVTGKEIDFGLLPQGRAETLGQQRWMKTADLLAVDRDSADYNETNRASMFYAQSWLMVHYFMSKQQMKNVSHYLDLVQTQHLSIRDAFAEAFAMEPEQFDKTLRSYFQGQITYFRAPAPPQVETSYTARPLDDLETRAVLADLHYHLKDYREQGIKEFEALIKQQPDNFVANRSLGYAYLRQNRFDEAAACFRRAAAQDSKDAQVHYYSVLLASRQAMMESRTPDDVPGMQKELQAAITLDPGYADAYNLLAYTQSLQGDLKAAQASMTKAVELAPRNDLYAANLVQYYLRDQDLEKAAPLLTRLQDSSNQEIAAMAKKNLELLGKLRQSMGPRQADTPSAWKDPTAPQWRPKPGSAKTTQSDEDKPEEPPKIYPVKHLYGTLLSVDCSPAPQATVTIAIAGKPRQFRVADTGKLILIGADKFSCTWHDRKVLINYKDSPQPEIVILELQ